MGQPLGTCFSDLERSLGIATRYGLPEHQRRGSFSDLERSLGIATVAVGDSDAEDVYVSVTSNGR